MLGLLAVLFLLKAAAAEADCERSKLEAELQAIREEFSERLAALDSSRQLQEAEVPPEIAERLLAEFEVLRRVDDSATRTLDDMWLLLCGALLMYMHVGFALVETGTCRSRSASDTLVKNLLVLCMGILGWWSLGYGLAEGELFGRFFGTSGFFGSTLVAQSAHGLTPVWSCPTGSCPSNLAVWFFNCACCTTSCTIVSGALLERVRSSTYAVYAFVVSAVVYPVVVAWTWGGGWLSDLLGVGFTDHAGGCVVHVTGGTGAVVGALLVGARRGRFQDTKAFEPHNLPLVVLGTLFLWVGWFSFNMGSVASLHADAAPALIAQVAVNTTLSGAVGGLVVFIIRLAMTRKYDVVGLCNGILAGAVSITAGCGNVHTGSAIAMASIGGIIYCGASLLLQKMHVDDPVDAGAVHFACGIWGAIAAAWFDWGTGLDYYHGQHGWSCIPEPGSTGAGQACMGEATARAILVQLTFVLSVVAWMGAWSFLILKTLTLVAGFRIEDGIEEGGLDSAELAQTKAYSLQVREGPDSWRVLWS